MRVTLKRMVVGAVYLLAFPAAALEGTADGAFAYKQSCASCHGADLSGGNAPSLKGEGFAARWGKNERGLTELVSKTMPPEAPGSLSTLTYEAITTFLMGRSNTALNPSFPGARAPGAMAEVPAVLPAEPKQLGTPTTNVPDDAELMNPAVGDWLRYNRDYHGQRTSPLTQITPANVAQLTPKCMFQLGETGSFEASPIVRAGKMYVTTAHRTYAIDAVTCEKLWVHEYVPTSGFFIYTANNRGVALYRGMVIRGTLDGHLIALDAETGKPIWDVWVDDSLKGSFLSAAPMVFDGKVYMGNAGADYGAIGRLHAFDAMTGRKIWTFNVIPEDGEPGRETWPKDSKPAGGSMWTTITVDPATRTLYVPTGNPYPDFDGTHRKGDNLYTNSVIVVDADTGKLKWHVQQVPHDVRDRNTAAAPILYTAGGRDMMVVGNKDARLYFYDRKTQKLIARRDLTQRVNAEGVLPPGKAARVCPGLFGGVEWYGPAYDPSNNLVFVNTVDWCMTLTPQTETQIMPAGGLPIPDPADHARGWLRAFDAVTGEEKWHFESAAPMLAALTPTATGLLLTGTSTGEFIAFEAASGKQLYSFNTGGAVAGGISTYLVNDKQYVAVASGNNSKLTRRNGGGALVVVFGLP